MQLQAASALACVRDKQALYLLKIAAKLGDQGQQHTLAESWRLLCTQARHIHLQVHDRLLISSPCQQAVLPMSCIQDAWATTVAYAARGHRRPYLTGGR